MDMAHLEEQLHAARECRQRLIATDGVFSMDGDIAPLKEIVQLARKHDAQVFVDECHATGILGRSGRGTDEACDVLGQVRALKLFRHVKEVKVRHVNEAKVLCAEPCLLLCVCRPRAGIVACSSSDMHAAGLRLRLSLTNVR